MNQDKKIQVVMLASEKQANIFMYQDGVLEYQPSLQSGFSQTPQHLYFLSDEKIKEGDWCIALDTNILFLVGSNDVKGINDFSHIYKKVIASTDESLIIKIEEPKGVKWDNTLPRPSNAFIQSYIEDYNKGNIITEVMVEYEHLEMDSKSNYKGNYDFKCKNCNHSQDDLMFSSKPTYCFKCSKLKVNPDNTINIKPVGETWTDTLGKEVVDYIEKYKNTDKYNDIMLAIEFGYQLGVKSMEE